MAWSTFAGQDHACLEDPDIYSSKNLFFQRCAQVLGPVMNIIPTLLTNKPRPVMLEDSAPLVTPQLDRPRRTTGGETVVSVRMVRTNGAAIACFSDEQQDSNQKQARGPAKKAYSLLEFITILVKKGRSSCKGVPAGPSFPLLWRRRVFRLNCDRFLLTRCCILEEEATCNMQKFASTA